MTNSIAVGPVYCNYSLDSGHQESSQPFIVNCMFRPLSTLDMQFTPDWVRPLHLVWSPDTHTVVFNTYMYMYASGTYGIRPTFISGSYLKLGFQY